MTDTTLTWKGKRVIDMTDAEAKIARKQIVQRFNMPNSDSLNKKIHEYIIKFDKIRESKK